jgi:hypothetical protein
VESPGAKLFGIGFLVGLAAAGWLAWTYFLGR